MVVSPEVTSEYVPTPEEVHVIFGALIETGKNTLLVAKDAVPKETKRVVDEKGLYELEIQLPGVLESEMTEYAYRRFPAPKAPEIHVAYYEDDMPVGGTNVARYTDGAWKFL